MRGRLSREEDLGPHWLAQAAGALVAAGSATLVVNPSPALYIGPATRGCGMPSDQPDAWKLTPGHCPALASLECKR